MKKYEITLEKTVIFYIESDLPYKDIDRLVGFKSVDDFKYTNLVDETDFIHEISECPDDMEDAIFYIRDGKLVLKEKVLAEEEEQRAREEFLRSCLDYEEIEEKPEFVPDTKTLELFNETKTNRNN